MGFVDVLQISCRRLRDLNESFCMPIRTNDKRTPDHLFNVVISLFLKLCLCLHADNVFVLAYAEDYLYNKSAENGLVLRKMQNGDYSFTWPQVPPQSQWRTPCAP